MKSRVRTSMKRGKKQGDKTKETDEISSSSDSEDSDYSESVETTDDDDDEDEESEESEQEPPKKKKKTATSKRLVVKLEGPSPVTNLTELIGVLEGSIKKNKKDKQYTKRVIEMVHALKELDIMIGMENVKKNIVNQLLLFLQDMNDPGMFFHTVLTGHPGSGKTTLCMILAKIYKAMGVLSSSEIILADRPKLIGQYLGETANKTKKVLESARGCILLIDEAYSLGDREGGKDSFSKECIDTLNQYLSEHVDELICIIAGYKEDLDRCFFAVNQGLARRFPWRYEMDKYTPDDLYKIMTKQMISQSWKTSVDKKSITELLKNNAELFTNNGGDTQNFLDKCKVCHAQRMFGSILDNKKSLSIQDFESGLKIYKESKSLVNTSAPFGLYL